MMTAAHLQRPPPFRPLLVLIIITACLYQSVGGSLRRRGGSNAVRLRDKRWRCHREERRCVVDSHSATSSSFDDNSVYPHLEGCKSVCGKHGSLWPIPKKVKLSATLNAFKLEDIAVKVRTIRHLRKLPPKQSVTQNREGVSFYQRPFAPSMGPLALNRYRRGVFLHQEPVTQDSE